MRDKVLNIIKSIKNANISFVAINIYIFLLVLIPKEFTVLFNVLPVRLLLSVLIVLLIILDIIRKKIELNKCNNIILIALSLLFLISTIPSFFASYNLTVSLYTLAKFGGYLTLFYLLSKIKFSKNEFKVILNSLIISGIIVVLLGIKQYVFDESLFKLGIEFYPGAKGRVISNFFNTIYFGIFINMLMPFILYKLFKTNKKLKIMFWSVITLLFFLAMILTFSRSAYLTFIGIGAMFLFFFFKNILKIRTYLLIIAMIFIITVVPGASLFSEKSFNDIYLMANTIPQVNSFLSNFEKEEDIIDSNDAKSDDENDDDINEPDDSNDKEEDSSVVEFVDPSLINREIFGDMGEQIGIDYYYGVGFGTYLDFMHSEEFEEKYPEYVHSKTLPHSFLILLRAEIGILGVIAFCILILYIIFLFIKNIIKYYFTNKSILNINVVGLITIAGYIIVNLISENAFYDTQTTFIFFTILGVICGYTQALIEDKKEDLE